MKRLTFSIVPLVFALSAPLAHASSSDTGLPLPLLPRVAHTSTPKVPTFGLLVNVRLDPDASSDSKKPVFESDLQLTDLQGAFSRSEKTIVYVSNVQPVATDSKHPVLSLDKTVSGVGVMLEPVQMYPEQHLAMIRVSLSDSRHVAMNDVDLGSDVKVQNPAIAGSSTQQTVALKVGETQDLKTPDGVLHLTLKSFARF